MLNIGKRFNIDFQEREPPTKEEVERIVAERATVLLEARLRDRDKLQIERMQRFVPLARSLGETNDEVAIMAMLLDDYYQQSLHPAPDPNAVSKRRRQHSSSAARKRNTKPRGGRKGRRRSR